MGEALAHGATVAQHHSLRKDVNRRTLTQQPTPIC